MVHSVGRLTRLGERSAGRPGKEPAHEINGKAQRTCLSARQRAGVRACAKWRWAGLAQPHTGGQGTPQSGDTLKIVSSMTHFTPRLIGN
jgi:hypothetical protein